MTTTYNFYEKTILDSINLTDYNIESNSDYNSVQEVYKIFLREYVHNNNKHLNELFLFSEWLRGLPTCITIPFYNSEILQNALLSGIQIKDNDNFLNDYWTNLSKAFFTLKENLWLRHEKTKKQK